MKKFSDYFNCKWGWFFTNGRKAQYKDNYVMEKDLENISDTLDQAKKSNLDTEVVAWALMYMKKNPNLTITEAMTLGYYEWIK